MSTEDIIKDWEQEKFPEFRSLHFKATKLAKAIHSQAEYEPGHKELVVGMKDWFDLMDEQLSILLDGTTADMKAGSIEATGLILKTIGDLPGNQKQYRTLLNQFNTLLSSPL